MVALHFKPVAFFLPGLPYPPRGPKTFNLFEALAVVWLRQQLLQNARRGQGLRPQGQLDVFVRIEGPLTYL